MINNHKLGRIALCLGLNQHSDLKTHYTYKPPPRGLWRSAHVCHRVRETRRCGERDTTSAARWDRGGAAGDQRLRGPTCTPDVEAIRFGAAAEVKKNVGGNRIRIDRAARTS